MLHTSKSDSYTEINHIASQVTPDLAHARGWLVIWLHSAGLIIVLDWNPVYFLIALVRVSLPNEHNLLITNRKVYRLQIFT